MRPIKFRAWDKKREQFVPQGEIVFSFYGDTRVEVVPNDLSYSHDPIHDHSDPGRFVVEQFTGLTDRNGTEIYEGDLVSNNFGIGAGSKEVVRQVVWDNAAFKLIKLYGKSSLGDTILLGVFQHMNFAVIGNIHTHPELIENAKS